MAKAGASGRAAAGRPRSEASRRAVLDATLTLLKTTSVRALTIEAIALQAGVGKTTIYRWWSSKTAVVIEALIDVMLPIMPVSDTKSPREAIAGHLSLLVKQYKGKLGRIVAEVLAEGQSEPRVLETFRDRFLADRRTVNREVVQRGIASGEFDRSVDVDTALDALYGSVYFRLISGHLPLDNDFAKSLPTLAMSILKPKHGR